MGASSSGTKSPRKSTASGAALAGLGILPGIDAREIIDGQKVAACVSEVADVMERRGLNLAECAEVGRLVLSWAGFEVTRNATAQSEHSESNADASVRLCNAEIRRDKADCGQVVGNDGAEPKNGLRIVP